MKVNSVKYIKKENTEVNINKNTDEKETLKKKGE